MLGWGRRLTERIKDGRTSDHHRRLFVPWQMSNRGFVDAATGVDVDSVDYLERRLCILFSLVLGLILS